MIQAREITGLVLAGGRGSRMGGADKGLQKFNGTPLALHALMRLQLQEGQHIGELMINANRNLGAYEAFGVPVWPDTLSDYAGPLAGFVACLPVLVLGILEARVETVTTTMEGIGLGEPLLFQWAAALLRPDMPEGATPKDGPSAGVGMCTALVSALTGIPVRADVAMTGEITLRGQVLAIGGLKEKLLAAHRGGIKTVIIPEENVRDLKEIPDNIKQDLQIKPVKWIDEVLQIALQYAPEPLPDVAPEIVAKDEKRESDSKERISTH